ncbi:MAG: hypothetical protein OEZ23_09815 [Gammaproteobacteria bacterium]|nr:hypothetical protein [Gammaproteobacteria bacterium]
MTSFSWIKLHLLFTSFLFLQACDQHQSGQITNEKKSAGTASLPLVEVIAKGANIAGANGIHFGPDGLLYVASVLGSEIVVMEPDQGAIIRRMGADMGVFGPDDIAFNKDGSYYWTSILTGEVAGFLPDGNKVIAARLTPGVNPITFSDDGRLFVSQCFFGSSLYEVDPMGKREARLISDQLGPHCGLNGMDWGPDNRLYGPRWFNGEVVSFDINDNTMKTEATGFTTPAAVKFNSRGELHVLDTGTGQVISVKEGIHEIVAQFEPGLDNFAFDKDDRLFVSSFTDGYIKRRNPDGSTTTLQPGGVAHPGGITLWKGQVVVADLHSIRGYDPDTGAETFTQRNILGMGKMGGAVNLSTDGDNLILVSWVDNDVRVWDQSAQELLEKYSGLGAPVSAVRYMGRLVVTEHVNNRVIALNESGKHDVLLENLSTPTGLYVDGDKLYLGDRSAGEIRLIAEKGQMLSPPAVKVSRLNAPEGFVVNKGTYYVHEAGIGHIIRIDPDGSRILLGSVPAGSPAASPAQPPSMLFNGLVLADDGSLFTTGETSRVIYKIH